MTPEQMFDRLLAREPSRPFVTFYDEATGERTELSVRSLANWVAKTHHLLTGELDLGVGDRAFVRLRAHWLSVVPILGCLTAGLEINSRADGSDVAFVGVAEDGSVAGETADGSGEVFSVRSPMPPVAPPAGMSDFATAVRPQADVWSTVALLAGPDDPAIDGRTRAEVADWAGRRARELGLGPGARVLTTRSWQGADDWIDTLLAPLAVGGSVVYLAHCDDSAVVQRRAEQERATNQI